MGDGPDDVDPSEAFSLVASETRFDILRALWDLTNEQSAPTSGPDPVSFGELRRTVGLRDSGQFNYHLDQLTPQFVRKVADGYTLTRAGRQVVGAAVSGVYTDLDVEVDPRPVGDCHQCGGTVAVSYEHGVVSVSCGECGLTLSDMPAPPVLVASVDAEELPAVLGRHLLTEIQRMNRGLCVHCGGPLESELLPREREGVSDRWNVVFTCRACGGTSASVVTGVVIDHPAVVHLLDESGVDIRETPVWAIEPILTASEEVVDEDPLMVETTVETDEGAVSLTVNEDLEVVSWERHQR